MDCRIELQVVDDSPIGIAHGIISIFDTGNANKYSKEFKDSICDLEEIANHLLNYTDSCKKKYSIDDIFLYNN